MIAKLNTLRENWLLFVGKTRSRQDTSLHETNWSLRTSTVSYEPSGTMREKRARERKGRRRKDGLNERLGKETLCLPFL